ncbi:hypothetical protein [Nocardia gipuzkoensis]
MLLETFDRLRVASELARRWWAHHDPDSDSIADWRRRRPAHHTDTAADIPTRHLTLPTTDRATNLTSTMT